jgi:dipeptidyl aminopeptidase/acylaminoacyl peptidase
VRGASGRSVLEFPAGTKLYETAGSISHARVSPKGDLVAFLDHSDQTDDRGVVRVVDREGRVRTLSAGPAAGVTEWAVAAGLAWHPSGREVWFTATADRDARAVWAVTLGGRLRPVARAPGDLTLHDISASGKVLVTRDARRLGILARAPGEAAERDLSLLDSSLVTALSADGKTVLFTELGSGVDGNYAAFLRGTDGSPPMHLGEGFAQSLSPDGRTALVLLPTSPKQVLAQPAGPAPPRKFLVPGLADFEWVSWHPDGKRILIAGAEKGRGERLYVRDLEGGKLRPVTPEGLVLSLYQGFPVSPTASGWPRWRPSNPRRGSRCTPSTRWSRGRSPVFRPTRSPWAGARTAGASTCARAGAFPRRSRAWTRSRGRRLPGDSSSPPTRRASMASPPSR